MDVTKPGKLQLDLLWMILKRHCWGTKSPQSYRFQWKLWIRMYQARWTRLMRGIEVNVWKRWTSRKEKKNCEQCESVISTYQKRAPWLTASPSKQSLHTQKHTLTQSPFTSSVLRGLLLKIAHSIFSHTQSNSHKHRRACSFSHKHFQKLDTQRNSLALTLCVLLFLTSFPLFPSTLWEPLLRETKSVISLVVLMHQTFLISGIEKRAAQR